MKRSKANQPNKRALDTLLEKGITATALGVAFLAVPLLLSASPVLKSVAAGFRIPGWLSLGVGLLLLGIHFAARSRADKTMAKPTVATGERYPTHLQDAFGHIPPPAPGGPDAESRRARVPQPTATHSHTMT